MKVESQSVDGRTCHHCHHCSGVALGQQLCVSESCAHLGPVQDCCVIIIRTDTCNKLRTCPGESAEATPGGP